MRPIPKIVFQHFRAPRNKGAIEGAQGVGTVAGRGRDAKLTLYLKLDEQQTIIKAGFESTKDRASDAPLSMVTTFIHGTSLDDAAALGVEEFAEAYGMSTEHYPMLMPAYEALKAAIANARGEPNPYAFEGGLVCTCLSVREGRIRRAVKERQLKTVEEVAFWTRACTGCRSCRPTVRKIIADENGE